MVLSVSLCVCVLEGGGAAGEWDSIYVTSSIAGHVGTKLFSLERHF